MKHYFLFLVSILLVSSCQKEDTMDLMPESETFENWFRSYPNLVSNGPSNPPIERGETHILLSFGEEGTFKYLRTTLGIYANTAVDDTSAWVLDEGTFMYNEDTLSIDHTTHTWYDTFYGLDAMVNSYDINMQWQYLFPTYELITPDSLLFEYYVRSDIAGPNAEIPHHLKNSEMYVKQ